jgi:hypothetical protein
MRAIVAGFSGRFRLKMLLPEMFQSMTSRAARQRFVGPKSVAPPVFECVGAGHATWWRPRRAMMKSRFRVVGSP